MITSPGYVTASSPIDEPIGGPATSMAGSVDQTGANSG
jgi:hypothetical protein